MKPLKALTMGSLAVCAMRVGLHGPSRPFDTYLLAGTIGIATSEATKSTGRCVVIFEANEAPTRIRCILPMRIGQFSVRMSIQHVEAM